MNLRMRNPGNAANGALPGTRHKVSDPPAHDVRPSLLHGQRNQTERPLHNSQGEMK